MNKAKLFRFKGLSAYDGDVIIPFGTKILRVNDFGYMFELYTSAGIFSVSGDRKSIMQLLKQEFAFDIKDAQAVGFGHQRM